MTRSKLMTVPAGQRGFTLLELLVGITVFALMAVSLYSALHLGARSWDAGDRRGAASEQMRLTASFLEKYVGSALPIVVRENHRWRLRFEGDSGSLRFVTDMPPRMGSAGLYEMQMTAVRTGDTARLAVIRSPYRPDTPAGADPPVPDRSDLADDLQQLRISYFGTRQPGEAPRWYDSWSGLHALPLLVRLQVHTRELGAWPPVVVRIQMRGLRYDTSAASAAGRGEEETPLPVQSTLEQ